MGKGEFYYPAMFDRDFFLPKERKIDFPKNSKFLGNSWEAKCRSHRR